MKYVVNCRQNHNGFSTHRWPGPVWVGEIAPSGHQRRVDARLCCRWPSPRLPVQGRPVRLSPVRGNSPSSESSACFALPAPLARPTGQGWHIGKAVWERLPITGVLIAGGCHHAARTRFAWRCRAIGSRAARFLQGVTASFGAFRSNLPQDTF